MSNIGIVGGTFDPIHNGHLLLGEQAYREYRLDEIWYMPSGQPPHKKDHKVTSASDRCAMVRLAIQNTGYFRLSEFETSRRGNTYTAQTLHLLREAYPQHTFDFIIGADSLYQIESWYHPEEVLSMVRILAADREYDRTHPPMDEQIRHLTERFGGRIEKLHCRELDVSSEDIRSRVAKGLSVEGMLPAAVVEYIYQRHLYMDLEDSL